MKKTLLVEDFPVNLATALLSKVYHGTTKTTYYTIQIIQGTGAVSIVIPAKDEDEAKSRFTKMMKLFKND